jgi:O-antigen/teichoic acid export membrane protein
VLKNIIKLGSANFLAQLLPFLITPIITRIYAPESFGVFSIFISIVAIASVVASARYELAIVISKKEQVKDIFILVFISSFVISILLFAVMLLALLNAKNLIVEYKELLFAPLAVFFTSLSSCLNYFFTRHEKFNYLGKAAVIKSVSFCFFQLTLFLIFSQSLSLILAWLASTITMFLYLLLKINHYIASDFGSKVYVQKIISTGVEFSNLPKFSMPASLVSALNSQFNIILIPIFFGKEILGFYTLVERILAAPISIVGNAIGQVYYANIANKDVKQVFESFKQVSIKIISFSILLYGFFYYILESFFVIVVGSTWAYSVVILKIFAFQFSVQLCISPLLMTLQKYKLNKVEIIFQVSVLTCYIGLYSFHYCNEIGAESLLNIVSKAISICYILVYIYMYLFLWYSVKKQTFLLVDSNG